MFAAPSPARAPAPPARLGGPGPTRLSHGPGGAKEGGRGRQHRQAQQHILQGAAHSDDSEDCELCHEGTVAFCID